MPISQEEMARIIGKELTDRIIEVSLAIYKRADAIANSVGIIIADTKIEFGMMGGELILIDEVLTPDSSRFWPRDTTPRARAAELRQAVPPRLSAVAEVGPETPGPGVTCRYH